MLIRDEADDNSIGVAAVLVERSKEIDSSKEPGYEDLMMEVKSYGSLNTFEDDKELISRRLGMRYSNNLEKYLRLPNMVGRNKKASFQNLKDRMKKKIDGWSIRFLSEGGKEVFIKSVRQAMPTYSIACFLLPKSLCSGLDSIIAKFWWQKGLGRRRIHWCDWKMMSAVKEEGGKCFWNLEKFNIALLAKQRWRLITSPDSLLAQVLKAKYFPMFDILNASFRTTPSYTWKSI
ncbi:hypothetical protein PVK06_047524 [Gossypium arboreum]|uniref:Reverse transcriptase n=1 Tax=Gossypium arboreum TaxID=29729 RepID=A0ABR0MDU7_GOSAR|nr:hypothetical protein PVK06_047524 [Gossypium arboreum]